MNPSSAIEVSKPLILREIRTSESVDEATKLTKTVRDVEVIIPRGYPSGRYHSKISCRQPGGNSIDHVIAWEVRDRLTATPSGIVVKRGSPPSVSKILISSMDRPFRITGIRSSLLGESAKWSEARSKTHILELPLVHKPANVAGSENADIIVSTDDPDQPNLVISVLILDDRQSL